MIKLCALFFIISCSACYPKTYKAKHHDFEIVVLRKRGDVIEVDHNGVIYCLDKRILKDFHQI